MWRVLRNDSPPAAPPEGIRIYTTTKLQESFNQNISPKIIKRKLQVFYEVKNYMFPIFTLVPTQKTLTKAIYPRQRRRSTWTNRRWGGNSGGKWSHSPSAGSPSTRRRRRSCSRSRTNSLKKCCYDRADCQPTTSCFWFSKFKVYSPFTLLPTKWSLASGAAAYKWM